MPHFAVSDLGLQCLQKFSLRTTRHLWVSSLQIYWTLTAVPSYIKNINWNHYLFLITFRCFLTLFKSFYLDLQIPQCIFSFETSGVWDELQLWDIRNSGWTLTLRYQEFGMNFNFETSGIRDELWLWDIRSLGWTLTLRYQKLGMNFDFEISKVWDELWLWDIRSLGWTLTLRYQKFGMNFDFEISGVWDELWLWDIRSLGWALTLRYQKFGMNFDFEISEVWDKLELWDIKSWLYIKVSQICTVLQIRWGNRDNFGIIHIFSIKNVFCDPSL